MDLANAAEVLDVLIMVMVGLLSYAITRLITILVPVEFALESM